MNREDAKSTKPEMNHEESKGTKGTKGTKAMKVQSASSDAGRARLSCTWAEFSQALAA